MTLSTSSKAGPRPRPPKLTAHRQLGHSFWPRRMPVPRYECPRCGMVKEPGTRAEMSCKDYRLYILVREVHSL